MGKKWHQGLTLSSRVHYMSKQHCVTQSLRSQRGHCGLWKIRQAMNATWWLGCIMCATRHGPCVIGMREREREIFMWMVKPVYLTTGTRRQYVPTISDVCLSGVLLCWKRSLFCFFQHRERERERTLLHLYSQQLRGYLRDTLLGNLKWGYFHLHAKLVMFLLSVTVVFFKNFIFMCFAGHFCVCICFITVKCYWILYRS